MACSSAGGGAAAPTVGGAVDSACNVEYHNEGCHNPAGPPIQHNRMVCTAGASGATWQLKATCGDQEVCVEQADPAAGTTAKKVTSCIKVTQPSSGTDTTSGSDTIGGGSDVKEATPKQVVACMQSKCAGQYSACTANAACSAVLNCVSKCNDGKCADLCSKSGDATSSNQQLMALSMCGLEKGCIPQETPKPVCGNGQCESGETTTSCASDCKTTTNPVCGNGKCEAGENIEMCPKDCKSGSGPVCGNSQCETGETASSCPADCGSTTSGTCGDLTCQAPETASTCPLDCDSKSKQLLSCAMEMCSESSACAADKACMTAVNCFLKCGDITPDSSCGSMCMSGLPTGTASMVGGLLNCVKSSCSSSTGPQCGNGKCESGEYSSNCPSDCPTTSGCNYNGTCESSKGETPQNCSDCYPAMTCNSNGTCEAAKGETASNCPSDCPTSTGFGCAGMCGKASKESSGKTCYCDDACAKQSPPDCCADKNAYCSAP